jgi:iron complex transport system permease protein
MTTGAAGLPLGDVLAALTGGGDATTRTIVLELRLPRVVLALVAGGGLAVAGAVFQALLRNPLAEPYVLGVAGGAAVGAVAALTLGLAVVPGAVPAAALAGAIGAILLVLRIAVRVGRALDTRVLLLAGVVVGAFFNAVILLLLTLADVESFRSACSG